MGELVTILAQVAIPLILVVVGLFVGRAVERAHLKRLRRDEARLITVPVTDLRTPPPGVVAGGGVLVTGSAVIGSDYFKLVATHIRKFFGGEIRSLERLMERARRQAICRMMESAHRAGATAVINVRLETADIGAMGKNPGPTVEVLAYGTAVIPSGRESGFAPEDSIIRCPRCGYDLGATPDPGCPECGWSRHSPAPPLADYGGTPAD